jgi:hypothetical protein
MHSDSPIKFLGLIRNRKVNLESEDSWLISNIMSLSLTLASGKESLAESLISMFSGHSILKKINRVSLVRRVGDTNQLAVVSSANRPGISNSMASGYSCFVNAGGSLFSINSNSVRFFSDASVVLRRYQESGHPPQRSIARIAKMDLGGGVCAPVLFGSRVGGFVFLNGQLSAENLQSDNVALILNLFFESMQKYLDKFRLSFDYHDLSDKRLNEYVGKRLNSMTLADAVKFYVNELTGHDAEISVKDLNNGRSFLVSHGNVAQIVGRILSVFGGHSIASIVVEEVSNKLEFRVSNSLAPAAGLEKYQKNAVTKILNDAQHLGISVEVKNLSEFRLSLDVELASSDASIDYSVEKI